MQVIKEIMSEDDTRRVGIFLTSSGFYRYAEMPRFPTSDFDDYPGGISWWPATTSGLFHDALDAEAAAHEDLPWLGSLNSN
jgi:hypothetical protein